jgi:transcription elongation GreA/GreB family factor
MREEFEKLVAAGKIGRQHVDPLVALVECGYCQHRSWGFGRIRQVDPVFGRFTIDFNGKPGHSMDLSFAAESLKPIKRDHILVRKAEDLAGLRQVAALHHLDLIRLVLDSLGGRATVDQIQHMLVPEVITDDWRKWWEAAKHEMKKDGHFLVPMKKTDPVVYQAQEVALKDRLMADFRSARGLKARLLVAGELLRNVADMTEMAMTLSEAAAALNPEIASHQRTQPALALEAIFMRTDLRAAAGVPSTSPGSEADVTEAAIWAQVDNAGRLLEQVAAAKHKRALESFRAARTADWAEVVLGFLNTVNAKLCTECANLLVEAGQLDRLKLTLARLISQHTASSELLLWLARERSDTLADILGPEVFRAMLSAIERDQFLERKSNRLRDYILDDQELLVELIESADIELIKDLTRTLQLSPSFDDMDKRSLLARIVKHSPVVQSLITGEHSRQDNSIVVSWPSLERRRAEYDDLVHKRIPANSHDIAVARSYGDLSENHEYKAAKEMHGVLMRRKRELESQLVRARGSDFDSPRTDVVSIGTRVRVTDLATQQREAFTLLGAWDFDAERHIISYLSPIAQALLNRKVGDEIELDLEGQRSRYRVDSIEAATPAEIPSPVPPLDPTQTPAPEPAPPATGQPPGSGTAPLSAGATATAAAPGPADCDAPPAEPPAPEPPANGSS